MVLNSAAPAFGPAALVPELLVGDLAVSLRFWCDLAGFAVAYDRPEEGFAYLARGSARVMLEDIRAPGRHWITAPLERPLGRGMNLQIAVPDAAALAAGFEHAGWPTYLALEDKSYRTGQATVTVRQFAVQDPDGYLLRFAQDLPIPC